MLKFQLNATKENQSYTIELAPAKYKEISDLQNQTHPASIIFVPLFYWYYSCQSVEGQSM